MSTNPQGPTLGIRTLLGYLVGNRQAILDVAANRHAVWLGLLLVLSAGFARDYDGEDLLHEPWHLLIPFGASLVVSLLLFAIAYGLGLRKGLPARSFLPRYRSFLGLFWMTAPLAWLYAIPYERFLSPADAVGANLWSLAVVAAWRVGLMARVLNVLLSYGIVQALMLVLLLGDAVVLLLIGLLPIPLIDVMAGIRLSEPDQVLQRAAQAVASFSWLTLPIWMLSTLIVYYVSKPAWAPHADAARSRTSRPLWGLVGVALLIWVAVLPFTQPEEQLRRRVETLFEQHHVPEALAAMSAHQPVDFPRTWTPPPRYLDVNTGDGIPSLLDAWDALLQQGSAPWVREVYLKKLKGMLRAEYGLREDYLARLGRILQRMPEGRQLVDELEDIRYEQIRKMLEPYVRAAHAS
ncbi:MAG TPA: hypothetical protein VFA18_09985 [Gemmataceae bacterium]|nr:hypothetical protein [Gemmataceae bacterium]